jgi:hypothetical protein
VDITNRDSIDAISDMLHNVDEYLGLEYFHGRSALVATHAEIPSTYTVTADQLMDLADSFEMPVYTVGLSNVEQKRVTAAAVMRLAMRSAHVGLGVRSGVTPLVARSTDVNMVASTIIDNQ